MADYYKNRLFRSTWEIQVHCSKLNHAACRPLNLTLCFLSACTTEVEKVCKDSDEDHLQPFKDKMEDFLLQGKDCCLWEYNGSGIFIQAVSLISLQLKVTLKPLILNSAALTLCKKY